MRRTGLFLALAITAAIIVVLSSCGGNASPASTSTTPPASPTSPTTPPSSGGGGASPSTAAIQWTSTMDRFTASPGTASGTGKVTIDTAGHLAIEFTGATPGASYNTQFCQFPYVPAPNQCFSIGTITADSAGAGQLSLKFPKSGTWGSGTFYLQSSSDFFNTAGATLDGTAMYQVVPASGVNQTPASSLPQDPLSSGTINVTNKTVTITVKGAAPNASYDVTECGSPTACFPQSPLMTDGSGDGTVTFAVPFRPASEFEIVRRSGGTPVASGFVSGFKVP